MMNVMRALTIALLALFLTSQPSMADSRAEMEREARASLDELYKNVPGARDLARNAKGILVFPAITKAGFVVGGQYGEGVLFKNGNVSGYYNTASASVGLQAGVQKYGYALFFMRESDLNYLKKSDGWDVGVGPNITVVDRGLASNLSAATAREGIYAFFFEQKGLMAGLGLQGTKITEMNPNA
jgi:lipid-binding SYLF domain-containing protein